MTRSLLAMTLLPIFAAHAADRESVTPHWQYQNVPAFLVNLSEVDPDSQEVVLEVYDWTVRTWQTCGSFFLQREKDRTLSGGVTLRVEQEGEYLLRSIARDRAGNTEVRGMGPDSADIVAVYDRSPPIVDVVTPPAGLIRAPLSEVVLTWRTRDAHPGEGKSVSVDISHDAGRTWRALASGLEDTGEYRFDAPAVESTAMLRVTAWDKSGNRGEGLSPAFEIRKTAQRQATEILPPIESGTQLSPAAESSTAPPTDPVLASAAKEEYGRAAKELVSGRYLNAIPLLRRAIDRDPNLEVGWLDLSVSLAKLGKLDAALRVAASAEARFAKSASFPYTRGLILSRLQRPAEAKESLRRAIHLDPAHPEAHWTLASLAIETGDLETAVRRWRDVVRYAPVDSALRKRALTYLQASQR